MILFLKEKDVVKFSKAIKRTLSKNLPLTFRGYPTNFSPPDLDDNGTQLLMPITSGPVNHRVEVITLRQFFLEILGFDIQQRLSSIDWLTFPEQKLLSVTAGAVYWDQIGLHQVRKRFSYYPHDIWLYRMAAGWARIGQEEHLMGRAGIAGDEIGSQIIASRLVRDLMVLCFLMEKSYFPYPKWFGAAFSHLDCASDITPYLRSTLNADNWQERQNHLSYALENIGNKHNRLKITRPIQIEVSNFHGRPFKVISGDNIAEALKVEITDPIVKKIVQKPLIGGIDQFSDSTDLLSNSSWRAGIARLFE